MLDTQNQSRYNSLECHSIVFILLFFCKLSEFHNHFYSKQNCNSLVLIIFFDITGKVIKVRRKQIHRPWTKQEIEAVLGCFEDRLKHLKLPGKREIEDCMTKNMEALSRRSWKDIKYYCKHYTDKLKRSYKKV